MPHSNALIIIGLTQTLYIIHFSTEPINIINIAIYFIIIVKFYLKIVVVDFSFNLRVQ